MACQLENNGSIILCAQLFMPNLFQFYFNGYFKSIFREGSCNIFQDQAMWVVCLLFDFQSLSHLQNIAAVDFGNILANMWRILKKVENIVAKREISIADNDQCQLWLQYLQNASASGEVLVIKKLPSPFTNYWFNFCPAATKLQKRD